LASIGTHEVPEQKNPARQSASPAHAVLHAVPSQLYGEQSMILPGLHVPVPLQVCASCWVEPVHDCAVQMVPDEYSEHAPLPLHMPVVPHVDGFCVEHSLLGSVPAVTGAHVPFVCPVKVFEQAWHVPAHADSQQTESTQ